MFHNRSSARRGGADRGYGATLVGPMPCTRSGESLMTTPARFCGLAFELVCDRGCRRPRPATIEARQHDALNGVALSVRNSQLDKSASAPAAELLTIPLSGTSRRNVWGAMPNREGSQVAVGQLRSNKRVNQVRHVSLSVSRRHFPSWRS